MSPIQFKPKFFTPPIAGGLSNIGNTQSTPKNLSVKKKKKSLDEANPLSKRKRQVNPHIDDDSKRVVDIDWVNQENIMADGSRVKFGAPRSMR